MVNRLDRLWLPEIEKSLTKSKLTNLQVDYRLELKRVFEENTCSSLRELEEHQKMKKKNEMKRTARKVSFEPTYGQLVSRSSN